MLSSPAALRNR